MAQKISQTPKIFQGFQQKAPEKIILASQNSHKCHEFGQLLDAYKIKVEAAQPFDCEENATSYLGNALIKARAVLTNQNVLPDHWVLADDSGLEVFALGMRPGLHSARYGMEKGQTLSSAQQNELLLHEMAEHPDQRGAQFVCCLVLLAPNGQLFFSAQASITGFITSEARAKNTEAFGYDPIFALPHNFDSSYDASYRGQTFAELGEAVKQKISHRYLACHRLFKSLF